MQKHTKKKQQLQKPIHWSLGCAYKSRKPHCHRSDFAQRIGFWIAFGAEMGGCGRPHPIGNFGHSCKVFIVTRQLSGPVLTKT